ncbi:hypothetical protein OsI_00321 [Oryza sativa Indica Group]|uniref:Peptidase A1 domain-containing protein n=1 Tax=Oryza sativa subsp. indica TaxID=39946 RepID=A2WKG9_ORYSI|nr:hypothetical protein OsI_00321 [Oryza sativa Indica Group]
MQPPILLPLLLLLLLLAAASPRPVLSRRHASPPLATETLDVAASLSRARAAVSAEAVPLHQSAAAAVSTEVVGEEHEEGRLALRLHSRDFLPEEQGRQRHASYRSLVLARLRRDSARAAAVSARAAMAADGVSRFDLVPANVTAFEASAAEIQGPVVSGVGLGSGEYFSRVGVGSPARQLYMVLDTGSDVTWVQCQPCADCYQQSDPVFDPSLSTSYASVACDNPRCHDLDAAACRNSTGACLYESLAAMKALKDSLKIPARMGWNGDPCAPRTWDAWEGVTCLRKDKGLVIIQLDLASQGLKGYITDEISHLTDLVVVFLLTEQTLIDNCWPEARTVVTCDS